VARLAGEGGRKQEGEKKEGPKPLFREGLGLSP
jgi:hypothetical protein